MRKCQNPDCDNNLPYDCRKEMKYCSVRCRVAMHRKARKKTPEFGGVIAVKMLSEEERDQMYRRIADEIEQAKDF